MVGKEGIVLIVDIVDMRDTVDSLDMGPFQPSRWGTRGSGCSRHRCLSRRCCPLIKKMVVVLTMMIICLEQEYLDDNNVDVFSVLSQSVQLCHLLMMFIQDVKMWIVANLDDLCIDHCFSLLISLSASYQQKVGCSNMY